MRVEHKRRLARLEEEVGRATVINPFCSDEERLRLLVEHCGLPPEVAGDPEALGAALEMWLYSDFLPRTWNGADG